MLHSLIDRLPLHWALRLALLRLAAQWRSLLTLVTGVLLAAVIGANVPLYTTAIAQVGMIQRLESEPLNAINLSAHIVMSEAESEGLASGWEVRDRVFNQQIAKHFDQFPGWITSTNLWIETQPLYIIKEGLDPEKNRLRVAYTANIEEKVDIIRGTWPATSGDVDLEAALSEAVANRLQVDVGDEFTLDQQGWDSSKLITVRITAILREKDTTDTYWMSPSPLRAETSVRYALEANLITTRDNATRIAQDYIPETRTLFGWRVLFDASGLPFAHISEAIDALNEFEINANEAIIAADSSERPLIYQTELPLLLDSYREEVAQLGIPFGLLLLQLGALVLFFLVVIAALVRRSERREIAILQSRGAYDLQILMMRSLEALIICTGAVVIAPYFARILLTILIPSFTGIDTLWLPIGTDAFLYAAGSAFFAFFVLIVTLIPVLRLPLILAGGSAGRSGSQSIWQRYYLDVVILIIGLVALGQLVSRNSAAATSSGPAQADPLLLLAPALLFFALGSALLRLFPITMRFIAHYFSTRNNVIWSLASWQVSRESLHYGRITFLLALAIGIGWFAISFQSTFVASQLDQANYRAGADARLIFSTENPTDIIDDIVSHEDVEQATLVKRVDNANLRTDLRGRERGHLLAIAPQQFTETAYWRDDFRKSMDNWTASIPATGKEIPTYTDRLGIWVRLEGEFPLNYSTINSGEIRKGVHPIALAYEISLRIRLRDTETGVIFFAPLRTDTTAIDAHMMDNIDNEFNPYQINGIEDWPDEGWLYYETDLNSLSYTPQGPVVMEGLVMDIGDSSTVSDRFSLPSHLSFANLTSIQDDNRTPLDWIETADWDYVFDTANTYLGMEKITVNLPDSEDVEAVKIGWTQQGVKTAFGLMLNYPALITMNAGQVDATVSADDIQAIPALVSTRFIEINNLKIGQKFPLTVEGVSVWFEIEDIVAYFPTLYDDDFPFIVVDQALLLYTIGRRPTAQPVSNEIWINLKPDVRTSDFVQDLTTNYDIISEVITRDEALRQLQTDPLSRGMIGLLFLSFFIGLVLSIVSLLTYVALTVQQRRVEFAVLRSIGISGAKIVSIIAYEQILVLVTSVALGSVLGTFLSTQVLPALSVNTAGNNITPPFAIQLAPSALLQYAVILALVLVGILLTSAFLVKRMATVDAMRFSEE